MIICLAIIAFAAVVIALCQVAQTYRTYAVQANLWPFRLKDLDAQQMVGHSTVGIPL